MAALELPDTRDWSVERRLEWLRNCTPAQWDAICKKCGVCCLQKVEISSRLLHKQVFYTYFACQHLDLNTRRCRIYDTRLQRPECSAIGQDEIVQKRMLPASCGYAEFVYGPAQFPANLDWTRVTNEDDLPHNASFAQRYRAFKKLVRNKITESKNWGK